MSQYPGVLNRRVGTGEDMDDSFYMAELVREIKRAKPTAPVEDQVSDIMLKNLGEVGMAKLLELYNRVWSEGRLPSIWKEAVVIPIRKPGKDPSKPSSYPLVSAGIYWGNLGKKEKKDISCLHPVNRSPLSSLPEIASHIA